MATPQSLITSNISDALASAAEQRVHLLPTQPSAAQLAIEHERRQTFRRLIDPGIVRPNSKEQALASLKTLLTIAENLLREPENLKYQQFKPTNSVIKKHLVDTKGTLEYAIELGFRPEVKSFQPYYKFNSRHMNDLEIGAFILREFLKLEDEKAERATRSKVDQKAVAAAVTQQVKLAYMDDRKTKMLRDEQEKERREARASGLVHQAERQEVDSTPEPSTLHMPGSGYLLNDRPPPYAEGSDDT